MARYIELDALVKEIEKRKRQNLLNEGAFEEDIDILSLINTLEVIEVDLDCNITGIKTKHAEGKLKECIESITEESLAKARKQLQKESVSEELEEAAMEYVVKEAAKDINGNWTTNDILNAFKAGAKWQEEQFEKNRLAACDKQTEEEAEIERDFCWGIIEKEYRQPTFIDAIKYGKDLQKQQMMAKAIDGEVGYWNLHGLSVNVELPSTIEEGDKVKVIVIKED